MIWFTLFNTASANCPQGPTSTVSVQRLVESAEFAFVDLDDAGLRANRQAAVDAVLCLGELIHPPHAAAFMRLEGEYAFVNDNQNFALDAFRSALTVQPDFQLRAAIAPAGGPLAQLYAQARSSTPTMWALPQPGKAVFVNGVSTTHAPRGLSVIQVVETSGQVTWTGIITGPEALPSWFVNAPAQPGPIAAAPVPAAPVPSPNPNLDLDPIDEGSGGGGSPKVGMLATSGVVALAAAGLYAGSIVTRGRYDAAPTVGRRQLTNNLFLGAAGTGIVAVGLGTVAIALPSKKKSDSSGTVDGVY